MAWDTRLGFPAHTLHPQGVCGIRKAAEPLTAALPYRCGESTTLSTISGYSKPEAVLSNNGNRSSRMLFFCDFWQFPTENFCSNHRYYGLQSGISFCIINQINFLGGNTMMQSSTSMRSAVSSIFGIHGPVISISLFWPAIGAGIFMPVCGQPQETGLFI